MNAQHVSKNATEPQTTKHNTQASRTVIYININSHNLYAPCHNYKRALFLTILKKCLYYILHESTCKNTIPNSPSTKNMTSASKRTKKIVTHFGYFARSPKFKPSFCHCTPKNKQHTFFFFLKKIKKKPGLRVESFHRRCGRSDSEQMKIPLVFHIRK